jgi:hypothetical protein
MKGPLTPRPTVYNGIQMRSRLEAGFAAWLDRTKIEWAYEPKAFADKGGQYLPDFRLDTVTHVAKGRQVTIYVEVKPDTFMAGDPFVEIDGRTVENPARLADRLTLSRRASVIKASEPDAELLLVQPRAVAMMKSFAEGGYVPVTAIFVRCADFQVGIATLVPAPLAAKYWQLGEGDAP